MARDRALLDEIDGAVAKLVSGARMVDVNVDGNRISYGVVDLPQLRAFRNEVAAEVAITDPEPDAIHAFSYTCSKGL